MIAAGMTVEEARRALLAAFSEQQLDSPQADARILVSHALHFTATDLVLNSDRRLEDHEASLISDLARRRLAREPIARILGEQEFFGLTFRLSDACLVPRADSEVIIEAALDFCRGEKGRVLDLGTGPGTLLLAFLSQKPGWTGLGIDLSEEACVTARANARYLGLSERVAFVQGSWTEPTQETFDCILTNPPYIASDICDGLEPEVRNHDPWLALDGGMDGLNAYRALAEEIPTVLARNGIVVVEAGIGQADDIVPLFTSRGLEYLDTRMDLAGIARCLVFRSRSG